MKYLGTIIFLFFFVLVMKGQEPSQNSSYKKIQQSVTTSLENIDNSIALLEKISSWNKEIRAREMLQKIEHHVVASIQEMGKAVEGGAIIKVNGACYDIQYYGKDIETLSLQGIKEANMVRATIIKASESLDKEGKIDTEHYRVKILKYVRALHNEVTESSKALNELEKVICKEDEHEH